MGAHDGLAQPPITLRVGRWALYHSLVDPTDESETGARTAQQTYGDMIWGVIGVNLECQETLWRDRLLQEGILRESGGTGQFYGLFRESEWVEYLQQLSEQGGNYDLHRPGETARALTRVTPAMMRESFLYCAPVAKPMHVQLWTTDRLDSRESIGERNPVVAFTILNDRWYRS